LYKDLKEFIEFDLEVAEVDVKTLIFDSSANVTPSNLLKSMKKKYGKVLLIEQIGFTELGESEMQIKILQTGGDNSWHELGIDSCDLGSDKSLDQFSKRVTKRVIQ